MRAYSTTAVTVTALRSPPGEAVEFARAMAGEKAVDLVSDRLMIVKECAFEIEREAGRLFWRWDWRTRRGVRSRRSISRRYRCCLLPARCIPTRLVLMSRS